MGEEYNDGRGELDRRGWASKMRLDGAAGATGQVYEPDGMILGFISVINGPSLSVLWKERDVLTSSGSASGPLSANGTRQLHSSRVRFNSRFRRVRCNRSSLGPLALELEGWGGGGRGCFAAINPSRGSPYARIQF